MKLVSVRDEVCDYPTAKLYDSMLILNISGSVRSLVFYSIDFNLWKNIRSDMGIHIMAQVDEHNAEIR